MLLWNLLQRQNGVLQKYFCPRRVLECVLAAQRVSKHVDALFVMIWMRFTVLLQNVTPYWRNVPAQLKALFDRTFAVYDKNAMNIKFGGAIAVGRGSSGGQAIVLNVIHNFYLSCGILCVPGELNGLTVSADKSGDVSLQPRRMEQARILGENILKYSSRF